MPFELTFRGVRGSIATPCRENLGVGGNTSCIELRLPNSDLVIFDAGTGIRQIDPGSSDVIHLFLTHFHWDHIQGLPFFGPTFVGAQIHFHSSCYSAPLRDSLARQMTWPYFPVDFEEVAARHMFHELGADGFRIPGLSVQPFPVNHPQGCCGYRIQCQDSVIIYAPDHEHRNAQADSAIIEASRNADLLIFDSQYSPSEKIRYQGRGHSSWEDATAVAAAAHVKQLALFHHDPYRDDDAVARIVAEAQERFPNTDAARENCTLSF